MSLIEISLIYFAWLMFSEKTLTNKDKCKKNDDCDELSMQEGRYTIFHALFEAIKEKDKRHKER
jgi:hypothetical protein